jgi:MoxR-like ATPase
MEREADFRGLMIKIITCKKDYEEINMQATQKFAQLLTKNVGKVIVGKSQVVELIMVAMLCRGHVLIEDVPGVGKTTLASALARSIDCSFKRIQFTPDITPSDITGFSMANFTTGELEYRPGLVMSQMVLCDEINRTSPKTQSSLLEVMEEGQVTVDGVTYHMPSPFMVLATQNPVDFVGTYPLPEAQLDRFFMRVSIGYPTLEEETEILDRYSQGARPMDSLEAICSSKDIALLQKQVDEVYAGKEARGYVAQIADRSRKTQALELGISTRAAISLIRASQSRALLDGRDYVTPDDIQFMAEPVLAHRLALSPEARMRNMTQQKALAGVMSQVQVPVKSR